MANAPEIAFWCLCGWEGTGPVLDAHFNPWCPKCGRPADFKLP
ncbi:MAG TPA: hypothetical protein VM889_01695 [Candidatus Thermoplasmatota archaeon]|nr:hypothetical protein [Candidatus Thermoplasmatota archaeon]